MVSETLEALGQPMKTKPLNWTDQNGRTQAASATGISYSVRHQIFIRFVKPYELQIKDGVMLEPVVSYHATLAEAKEAAQDDLTAKVEADVERER